MPQLLLMQHGSATYLEVLIARQSLLQAEIEQTQNRLAEMCGVIDLYIALGGASE
jgi:outer membrane protein TolC